MLKQEQHHLPHLDGVRGVAALTVFVTHLAHISWPAGRPKPEWWQPTMNLASTLAADAVLLFITLSGFCLMLPVVRRGDLRGGALQFYKKRARRILPPYWAAMLFCWILYGLLFTGPAPGNFKEHFPVTFWGTVSHIFLFHNLVQTGPELTLAGNYEFSRTFWTIAVEWQIYFWFPLFVLLWRKAHPALVAGALLLVAAALERLVAGTWLQGACFSFYGLFALGMLGCWIAYGTKGGSWRGWGPLALLLLVACYGWSMSLDFDRDTVRIMTERRVLFGLFSCALLIASTRGVVSAAFGWRPLAFVGMWGYSLYLLHSPIFQGVYMALREYPGAVPVVGVIVGLLGSYAFHLVAERPFMSVKQKKAEEEHVRAAVAAQ